MTATFLVELEIDDPSEVGLQQDATLIADTLTDYGLLVVDVQPWSRQNQLPTNQTDLSTLASVFPSQTPQPIQPIPTI